MVEDSLADSELAPFHVFGLFSKPHQDPFKRHPKIRPDKENLSNDSKTVLISIVEENSGELIIYFSL